jgi:isoleucyl-tRNA synthetase
MLTPLLPFTMEEAYQQLPGTKSMFAQLNDYPIVNRLDSDLLQRYDELLDVRDIVLKKLEEGRSSGIFGSAQEARVVLTLPQGRIYELLSSIDQLELARYFIVSEVELTLGEAVVANVSRHQGHKCDRCWNYYDDINQVEEVKLCTRCLEALNV